MPPEDITTSLKDYILQEVRQRIISGQYAPGQRLSENILARELETSRAPVRDALMTLRSEGLVLVYPQRGSYVFNPSHAERVALCEVSAVYEMGALTLAIEYNAEHLCHALDEQMHHGEEALQQGDMLAWARADRLFHESIIKLSANPFLAAAYQTISSRIATLVHRLPSSPQRIAMSVAQHRRILTLICKKELVKAAEALRANNIAVATLLKESPDGKE